MVMVTQQVRVLFPLSGYGTSEIMTPKEGFHPTEMVWHIQGSGFWSMKINLCTFKGFTKCSSHCTGKLTYLLLQLLQSMFHLEDFWPSVTTQEERTQGQRLARLKVLDLVNWNLTGFSWHPHHHHPTILSLHWQLAMMHLQRLWAGVKLCGTVNI